MKPLKIVVYTNVDWNHALAVLRFRAPFEALGWEAISGQNGEIPDPEQISQADLVLLQRGFPFEFDAFVEVLRLARLQNKPVLYEIDDWLFGLPEDHPVFRLHIEQMISMLLGIYEADAILVSSPVLQSLISAFHTQVWLCPNGLPDRLWDLRLPPKPISDVSVVIGYMGTATHLSDLAAVAPALLRVLEARENVILRVWGCPLPEVLQSHPKVETVSIEIRSYEQFVSYFNTQQVDFWIAPLLDMPFNRAKSPIKFWEYVATGASGVFQNMPPYTDVIQPSQNGMLATTSEEWVSACLHLIDHPLERYRQALAAQETLRTQGLLSAVLPFWEQAYRRSLEHINPQGRELSPDHEILRQVMYRLQKRALQRHRDTVDLLARMDALQVRFKEVLEEKAVVTQELQSIQESRCWRMIQALRSLIFWEN